MSNFRLGVICGGPSGERGISLNSARSVMDHLWEIDVVLYYMNPKLEVFLLDPQQVYSNTPEDFDFKLHDTKNCMNQKKAILLCLVNETYMVMVTHIKK